MSIYHWGELEIRAFICGVLVGSGTVILWWRAFYSGGE